MTTMTKTEFSTLVDEAYEQGFDFVQDYMNEKTFEKQDSKGHTANIVVEDLRTGGVEVYREDFNANNSQTFSATIIVKSSAELNEAIRLISRNIA